MFIIFFLFLVSTFYFYLFLFLTAWQFVTRNPHPLPVTRHPSLATRYPSPATLHPLPVTRHPSPVTRHPPPATRHPRKSPGVKKWVILIAFRSRYSFVTHSIDRKPRDWGLARSAFRASVALRATFRSPARIWLAVIDFQNGEQRSRSGSDKKRRNRLQ